MRLDLFLKLTYESRTIILFVGIRYSMRDLLFDLNNYAWPAHWRYASDMSSLPLASAGFSKLWILCLNNLLDGDLCKNFFYFHILSSFPVYEHNFIRCVDFNHIAPSNTALMTSPIRSHIEYLTQTYYILVLTLQSKLIKNLALIVGLIRFNDDTW